LKSLLKAELDMMSLEKKIKKVGKAYGENQNQAVKRWGVQTCRDLAKYSQPFGSGAKKSKMAMFKDANNVIFTHKGTARASKTGKSMVYNSNSGGRAGVSNERYLRSEEEVLVWIERYRTAAHRRTVKLSPSQKAVCSEATFKRAINQKYRATAGMIKDGWLDAGEHIARRQKGKSPAKIGKSLYKYSRKSVTLGKSKQGARRMKHFGLLMNRLSYASSGYVLSPGNKKRAVRDGAINTLKWYKRAIFRENQKKK
jgi:hypothetical protein